MTMNIPGLLSQPSGHEALFIESAGISQIFGHGAGQMTDSLAAYDIFFQLDSQLRDKTPKGALAELMPVLKASSHQAKQSLEEVVNAWGRLFVPNYTPLTIADQDNREALYARLKAIKEQPLFQQVVGLVHIDVLTSQSQDSLVSRAKTDIAYRYALKELNPFAVMGNEALFTQHNENGSLNLYDPATGSGSLSQQYLKDRSAFLTNKIWSGTEDRATESGDALAVRSGPMQYFEDRRATDPYKLYVGAGPAVSGISTDSMSQYIFGSSQDDQTNPIQGGSQADHFYGMGGNDRLIGGKGNDYLEGGQGSDTYVYNSGDGLDALLDTDGLGKITFDGVDLNGGERLFWGDLPQQ